MSQTTLILLGIGVGAISLALVYAIVIYNHLITLKNRFNNAFAQIDVQLQRRYDLIPNLVNTAKSYLQYEQQTLEKVVQARNSAHNAEQAAAAQPADPQAMRQLIASEQVLKGAMGQFFALVENYPDLKANQSMQQLMEALTNTENKVSFARQAFNDAVMLYNTYRCQFPYSLIAARYQFNQVMHFEVAQEKIREPIQVNFNQ
jgi:LemA protein